jgi:hypothetical protein
MIDAQYSKKYDTIEEALYLFWESDISHVSQSVGSMEKPASWNSEPFVGNERNAMN